MNIEAGSTSQSLVMYLQDAVTGGAYSASDHGDMTFDYVREGADTVSNSSISLNGSGIGTWVASTAIHISKGLWQIDFVDAAFAVGVAYVKLLVTHDNGDFIPKCVHVDLTTFGTPVSLDSGAATLAGMLTKMAEGEYAKYSLIVGKYSAIKAVACVTHTFVLTVFYMLLRVFYD